MSSSIRRDSFHPAEERAHGIGDQLFVQVEQPFDGNIVLREIRGFDSPPLEQRGLFLLRQALDEPGASFFEPPDFDDDRNDTQHPRFGIAVDRKRFVRSAPVEPHLASLAADVLEHPLAADLAKSQVAGALRKARVEEDAIALFQFLLDHVVIPHPGIVGRTRIEYENFVQVDAIADIVRGRRGEPRGDSLAHIGHGSDFRRDESVYIEMNIHRYSYGVRNTMAAHNAIGHCVVISTIFKSVVVRRLPDV